MKTAIISITENGRKLSRRISDSAFFLNTERYCFCSHTDEVSRSFEDLKDLVSGIFKQLYLYVPAVLQYVLLHPVFVPR